MAGPDVYALEATEGKGSVTVVVEPTGEVEVTPVPAVQGWRSQLQDGVLTVTTKVVVLAVCYAL